MLSHTNVVNNKKVILGTHTCHICGEGFMSIDVTECFLVKPIQLSWMKPKKMMKKANSGLTRKHSQKQTNTGTSNNNLEI